MFATTRRSNLNCSLHFLGSIMSQLQQAPKAPRQLQRHRRSMKPPSTDRSAFSVQPKFRQESRELWSTEPESPPHLQNLIAQLGKL